MMYIRTKDGRIIDTTKIVTGSKYMDFATNDESFRVIFKTEPLAKSENLEELCDGFYIDEGDEVCFSEAYMDTNFNKIKAFYLSTFDFTSTLYGFIKTKNGLMYIAKLNKKGKLELI